METTALPIANKWTRQKWTVVDWGALLFLVLAVVGYSWVLVDFSGYPFEDAAMLMRYAHHFADGQGLVWNIGQPPIDGATDFLFTILIGLLARAGLSLELAVQVCGWSAHLACVCLVYMALRIFYQANRWLALYPALYLLAGPGLCYVAVYFGTPVFALSAALTWVCALWIIERGESWPVAILFSLSGLVTGLIRPEGVILAGLMMAAILWCKNGQAVRRTLVSFLTVFILLGGAYFLWRWAYFGYPLPNPYYKKGGGQLYWGSLKASVQNVLLLAGPFLPIFILGLRSPRRAYRTIGRLIPAAGFTGAFILLSNEMNYLSRFQYAALPLLLIVCYDPLRSLADDLRLPAWFNLDGWQRAAIIGALTLWAGLGLYFQHQQYRAVSQRDGRYAIAQALHPYQARGYTMAVSEAGLLPYYSDWQAIDTWGLNDNWIAHHGSVTFEYLDAHRPEIIMFHTYSSPLSPLVPVTAWDQMAQTLETYVRQRGYILAAAYGESPRDTHCYYVRPDFPDSAAIIALIRQTNYIWLGNGRDAFNYALFTETSRQP